MRRRLTLELFKTYAESKGGVCLSEEYVNIRSRLLFRCSCGHEFEATGDVIRNDSWCIKCCGRGPLSLDVFVDLAREKGGECLSTSYERLSDPLLFRCANGHEFHRTGASLKKGGWCDECVHDERRAELEATARSRGGELLSERYLGSHVHHEFRCANGHEFSAVAHHVKNSGAWCGTCYRERGRKAR